MSVTIKDIARQANVSHTTVSRALNDSPLINPETKERIRSIASSLHYIPNIRAKSLVKGRTYNIGLFFTTLGNSTSPAFFYETVGGVNAVIKDSYNLVVRAIDDYGDYGAITKKSFDGVIIMSQSAADDAFIRYLREAHIPHAVLNRRLGRAKGTVNVLSDDKEGAFRLVEHLIGCGHKRIAIIEGREGFQSSQERKAGYLQALAAHGLTAPPDYRQQGRYDPESGYLAMRKLLAASPLPTAVFCANDEMAVGAMRAAQEAGLKLPDDMSVAGFDDNVFSGYLSPALTTVRRPIRAISQQGAACLLELIERKHAADTAIYLETELVLRESVKTYSGR
ncbi:LacI family DNA-binding transcriptional regulator [Paenibacillus cymbidii]|uniref:LacI family DNA-binding transcriptional regulator n=1 Tax=Paenibacillus cymbidii TaxID=1639034 RepID=UPI001081B0FD